MNETRQHSIQELELSTGDVIMRNTHLTSYASCFIAVEEVSDETC
jgi:hypothetical protein